MYVDSYGCHRCGWHEHASPSLFYESIFTTPATKADFKLPFFRNRGPVQRGARPSVMFTIKKAS